MLKQTGAQAFQRYSLVIALLLTLFSTSVLAQATACNKPAVFYVNGVNTSPRVSTDGAKELSLAIKEKFPQYGVAVEAIYNPSEGLLGDVTEVAVTQHWLRTGAEFVLAVVADESDAFARFLQRELDDVAAIFRRIDAIEKVKTRVLLQLKTSPAPVVLIAHSQGNIIVNEAVRQLKTSATTSNVPGVKTIAVLGIASVDKLDMPSLLEQGANINLYKHISSDTDVIVKPIQGNPAANFFSNPTPIPRDILGHRLIDVYLDKTNLGRVRNNMGVLQDTTARTAIVDLFDELYRNAATAWPCFTLNSTPNPSDAGQEVTFSVTAKARLSGGVPLAGQAMSLISGDLASSTLICSATFDGFGKASCRQTFLAPARTEKVRIIYKPSALPVFMSDPYSHLISGRVDVGEVKGAIKITRASCLINGEFFGRQRQTWTIEGTAEGSPGLIIFTSERNLIGTETVGTTCQSWTGRYRESGNNTCTRLVNDPLATSFTSTINTYDPGFPFFEFEARLFNPNFLGSSGRVASNLTSPPISCDGVKIFPR